MKRLLDHRLSGLERIEPVHTAILAVHWQVDVVKPEGRMEMFGQVVKERGIIENTAALIAAGRKAGSQIVYVNACYKPGHPENTRNNALFNSLPELNCLVRGTRGVEVIPELAPHPEDFVVEHTRISSFFGTNLDTLLRSRDIKTVLVTGVATNVAVDNTIRDAVQLGYDAILIEDCCYSSSEEYHLAALKTMHVLATLVTNSRAVIERLN